MKLYSSSSGYYLMDIAQRRTFPHAYLETLLYVFYSSTTKIKFHGLLPLPLDSTLLINTLPDSLETCKLEYPELFI